jgi:hypothetical protein
VGASTPGCCCLVHGYGIVCAAEAIDWSVSWFTVIQTLQQLLSSTCSCNMPAAAVLCLQARCSPAGSSTPAAPPAAARAAGALRKHWRLGGGRQGARQAGRQARQVWLGGSQAQQEPGGAAAAGWLTFSCLAMLFPCGCSVSVVVMGSRTSAARAWR